MPTQATHIQLSSVCMEMNFTHVSSFMWSRTLLLQINICERNVVWLDALLVCSTHEKTNSHFYVLRTQLGKVTLLDYTKSYISMTH